MLSFLILRMSTAVQNAYLAPPGKLFINTETGLVFVGDGATVGGIQVGLTESEINQLIGNRFDTLTINNVAELQARLSDLAEQDSLSTLSQLVNDAGKVDQSALDTLIGEVMVKANTLDVDTALSQKASAEELEGLAAQVSDKVNQTVFDETLSAKAIQADLEALQAEVSNKATTTALNALQAQADLKADQTSVGGLLEEVIGTEELFASGLIKNEMLPAYVDDVLEFSAFSSFPTVGEKGKIYVALDGNLIYRWSGTQYISVASPELIQIATQEETNALTLPKRYVAPFAIPALFGGLGFGQTEGGEWYVDGGLISRPTPLTGTYLKRANLSTDLYAAAGTALGGKLYVMTGRTKALTFPTTTLEYNPATNAWASKAPAPRGKYGACAASNGQQIFLCNGRSSTGTMYRELHAYNPVTNQWSTKAVSPYATDVAAMCHVDNKLYMFGGGSTAGAGNLNTIGIYDIDSNSWNVPTINGIKPTGRSHASVAAYKNGFFMLGGYPNVNADLWYFDIPTLSWTQLAPPPLGIYAANFLVVKGYLYLFGGRAGDVTNSTIYEYDPEENSWRTVGPSAYAVTNAVADVIDDVIYVASGTTDTGSTGSQNQAWTIS